jgi:hypothetical protein
MKKTILFLMTILFVVGCLAQQLKEDTSDIICFYPVGNGAEFPGGIKAWRTYLIQNTNTSLGAKYLKIPNGEASIKKSVIVNFVINKDGYITDVKADSISIATIHKKLVLEAIRVIRESPKWKPASLNGKKVVERRRQPITFVASN